MNTTDYDIEVMRLLDDRKNYHLLPRDPLCELQELINKMVSEARSKKWIMSKEAEFLNNIKPRTPAFYILPKVHKAQQPPPGRPIVS